MRLGKVQIAQQLTTNPIVQRFLDETKQLRSSYSMDYAGYWEFLLEHKEFRELKEGERIPEYVIEFVTDANGNITRLPAREVY